MRPHQLPRPLRQSVSWSLLITAVLWGAAWPGAAVTTGTARAVNVAGLVIDYGDGRTTFAVIPFVEDSLSGSELLHRSGLDLLTVDFGGMGEGVCQIEEIGCDVSPCRARLCQTGDPDSPFWHYAQESGEGTWEFAPLGASSSRVSNGTVDGWFWRGDDPPQPAVSLDEIANRIGIDLDDLSADDLAARVATVGDDPIHDSEGERVGPIAGISILAAVMVSSALSLLRARSSRAVS
jgi:hypothetical protein